jgi:hypothetical protein
VSIEGGPTFHFREVTPRDFYLAQVLRQADKSQVELLERLLVRPEVLSEASSLQTRAAFQWGIDNLLNESVLTVENWLEVAYHLCKQRWDSSVDWMERQPMSKINLMIDIVKKHADDQEKEMKKNARRKR